MTEDRRWLSYHLPDAFIEPYRHRPVDWGFRDAGGNALGELVFYRTYSRRKADGTKERWWETCRRVVEGTESILKDDAVAHRLPWDEDHAHQNAQEMFDRMFHMKWLPPGRGLWMMGTEFVHATRDATALQNCAFISTAGSTPESFCEPFRFLMLASMLGVGVGFDTRGAEAHLPVHPPQPVPVPYVIADTREGWANSTAGIIAAFTAPDVPLRPQDYSLIRPAGSPITGFGGTASGPEPLRRLHTQLYGLLDRYAAEGRCVDSRLIVDIGNLMGRCVVAGNVRRSAEIALGSPDDADFVALKDYARPENRERSQWGWVSNNSVVLRDDTDPPLYERLAAQTAQGGEPGYLWLDVARVHGRLADPPDRKDRLAAGVNPCGEQVLESGEMCTLVETFPTRCRDLDDFRRTIKYAFIYAKAVTLLPTVFPESNAVMARNRRIGTSASGLAQFAETHGWSELRRWLDRGYAEVRRWDEEYSRWLGVRESIRVTSVKPSGSVSLLAGVTPGVHFAVAGTMLRAVRLGKDEPLTEALRAAGYRVEPAVGSEGTTVVVYLPIRASASRPERDVSIWEKAELAALAQEWWADNAVSATITFDPETERDEVGRILHAFQGRLKAVSFLPRDDSVYPQMPYTSLDEDVYAEAAAALRRIDWDGLYSGSGAADAVGEAYCTSDRCELPSR